MTTMMHDVRAGSCERAMTDKAYRLNQGYGYACTVDCVKVYTLVLPHSGLRS